ncbi:four helix bundle protein [Silvibacterium bohemicum]|uniref:Four helix bundle protein n=1 Tax=Silvibacterium bohemicum TaxID=1577686 RepID=A0A841JLG1_9BACT|nr:four helix bundle protein [Silvibacterium bohemicum]MBB6142186.1 four helix bundle protein [Silvibacterium bohemicum]
MIESYRELHVWQRSVELSVALYRLTANFPREEIYGLTNQLRRASVSIASNIAEGYGRGSRGEYKQFLAMARGSNFEVQTQLVIVRELQYTGVESIDKVEGLSIEVGKMLTVILKKL